MVVTNLLIPGIECGDSSVYLAITTGGMTISVQGMIQLSAGPNINSVASSTYATNVSGTVVPELASMLLFGSSLLVLGSALRRRGRTAT
jgi:hypothetical protein